jgi:hypothetical protein
MANFPLSFQNMINKILKDMIDLGIVAYIHDILIYRETKKEHKRLVKEVLTLLQKSDLAASIDKCEFHKPGIEILNYIISDTDINMTQDTIRMVIEWERPKTQIEGQACMGFTNFYCRFSNDFSTMAKPLWILRQNNFRVRTPNGQIVAKTPSRH